MEHMEHIQLKNLKFTQSVARLSKDDSKKVGAVFFSEDQNFPIAYGYNGMSRGVSDFDSNKNERPEKYNWFEHAERNAIYNVVQPFMREATILCSNYPNMEGARAIVAAGIKEVVVTSKSSEGKRSAELFKTVGVVVKEISMDEVYSDRTYRKVQSHMTIAIEYGKLYSCSTAKTKAGVLILNKKTFAPISMGAEKRLDDMFGVKGYVEDAGCEVGTQQPEKDAIFSVAREKLKNSTAYVSWYPCSNCAIAIISVGVNKVVTQKPNFCLEADKRWKPEFLTSMRLFSRFKVDVTTYEESDIASNDGSLVA